MSGGGLPDRDAAAEGKAHRDLKSHFSIKTGADKLVIPSSSPHLARADDAATLPYGLTPLKIHAPDEASILKSAESSWNPSTGGDHLQRLQEHARIDKFFAVASGSSSQSPGFRTPARAVGMDAFEHPSMVAFATLPAPGTVTLPRITDDRSLEPFLHAFGFDGKKDGAVYFDKNLEICGLTKPADDPIIGKAAFKEAIEPHPGVLIRLSDEGIALQLAVTIAHEMTHARQFDNFRLMNASKIKSDKILPEASLGEVLALQEAVLETLAYQSEVRNLDAYVKAHGETVSSHRASASATGAAPLHEQIEGLQDIASTMRDRYFETVRSAGYGAMFNDGKIAEILAHSRRNFPDIELLPTKSAGKSDAK